LKASLLGLLLVLKVEDIATFLLNRQILVLQLFEVIQALDDDLELDSSLLSSALSVVEVLHMLPLLQVLGRGEDIGHLLALLVQVLNGHQNLTSLSDALALQLGVFIPLSEEETLLLVDRLQLFLLLGHVVIDQSLLHLHLVLELAELSADVFVLVCVFLLLEFEFFIFGNKLLITAEDVDELGELVGVGVLDLLEELFELLHGLHLALDLLGFSLVDFEELDLVPDLVIELFDPLVLHLGQLNVLLLAHFLLLEEG